jgi:hypothetical protein
MDEGRTPPKPDDTPHPARPDLGSWRGDIREHPPAWRRRPRAQAVRELWDATRPLLAQLGEGRSWT